MIPPCFYIHIFPSSLWPLTISNSSISDHPSSCFSTSRTNGPHLLSQSKAGTHSPSPTGSHTTAHTAKHGHFGWGRYLYPRTVLRGSETLRGQRVERRTLPLWGLGRGVLSKNAKSLRDSDALMRVAVPRRRGPAGLRRPTPPAERTVPAPISPRVQLCLRRPAFPLSAFIPGA